MRDSFDRVISYLRVSVTGRCNLRCDYCSPEGACGAEGGSPAGGSPSAVASPSGGGGELPLDVLASIAEAAVGLGARKVRITGGEPLLREGLPGFVARLAARPGLESLSMTTNGTLLAGASRGLAEAGLMSVNVSIDSLDPAEYRRKTGGDLAAALEGVGAALRAGLAVKLNAVVAAGDGPSAAAAEEVGRYAARVGAAFQRIRRYDPAAPKVYDPLFDRPPPCAACDRIRLLSDGRLLACLHSSAWVPVDLERVEESILACVAMKPASGSGPAPEPLRRIGG